MIEEMGAYGVIGAVMMTNPAETLICNIASACWRLGILRYTTYIHPGKTYLRTP